MVYQPGVGQHPNELKAKWVGKEVTVRWRKPVFTVCGLDETNEEEIEYIHKIIWYGYVEEMGMTIAEYDLKPIPKGKK